MSQQVYGRKPPTPTASKATIGSKSKLKVNSIKQNYYNYDDYYLWPMLLYLAGPLLGLGLGPGPPSTPVAATGHLNRPGLT